MSWIPGSSYVSGATAYLPSINFLSKAKEELKQEEAKVENTVSNVLEKANEKKEAVIGFVASTEKAIIAKEKSYYSRITSAVSKVLPLPKNAKEWVFGGVGGLAGKGAAAVWGPKLLLEYTAYTISTSLQNWYVPGVVANGVGYFSAYVSLGAAATTVTPWMLAVGSAAGGAAAVYTIRAGSPLAYRLAEAAKNGATRVIYGTAEDKNAKIPADAVLVTPDELKKNAVKEKEQPIEGAAQPKSRKATPEDLFGQPEVKPVKIKASNKQPKVQPHTLGVRGKYGLASQTKSRVR